jgi:GDP-4-dehydro-6-deoxy-D-mannose reductase
MRVLVTGAASFTARHLAPVLVSTFGPGTVSGTDVAPAGPDGLPYRRADVTRRPDLDAVVRELEPELVFHLAGVASGDADACFAVNLEGTRNLLAACAGLSEPPRLVLVSSAAVYGAIHGDETPVRETTPLRPVTPYGASKAAAEVAALSLHRQGRLPVLVIRPFNLVGPGLPRGLAPADFAHQVRRIRDGAAPPRVRTGDLSPRRDFVDVRDAVRAYVLLARKPGCYGDVFNVGSGRPAAVGDLLRTLMELAGVRAAVETDPALLRPVDVPEQVAGLDALRRAVSWTPDLSLSRSLQDMLDAASD